MATLREIHSLAVGSPDLQQRFFAARLKAAWDVWNEPSNMPNNAKRLTWAIGVLNNYQGSNSFGEYSRFLSNATIQTAGAAATDNDIQFVVNSFIDAWSAT